MVTELEGMDKAQLAMSTRSEQSKVLQEVLMAADEDADEEKGDDDEWVTMGGNTKVGAT